MPKMLILTTGGYCGSEDADDVTRWAVTRGGALPAELDKPKED